MALPSEKLHSEMLKAVFLSEEHLFDGYETIFPSLGFRKNDGHQVASLYLLFTRAPQHPLRQAYETVGRAGVKVIVGLFAGILYQKGTK